MRGEKKLLQQLVADLGDNDRLVIVGAAVSGELENLAHEMATYIRDEISSYGSVTDPAFLKAGWLHGFSHAQKISQLLQRESVGDLQFVVDHANERARQRFPLNDILHTYRIGHRVMWNFMRDVSMKLADEPEDGLRTAMQLADFTIRYTNLISVVLTRGYIECEKKLISTQVRQARLLFDELSQGQIDTAEAQVISDSLGIGRRPYLVAAIGPLDATVSDGRVDTDSIPNALERLMLKHGIDSLVDDRHETRRALLVPKHSSTGFAERARQASTELALEQGVLIGLSVESIAPSDFPKAVAESLTAVKYASKENQVADLQSLPIHKIYLDNRHLDFERLSPPWYAEFAESDASSGGALRQTIQAYADADLSIKRAARDLGIHPNTVRFRITKIERITAISPKSFRGLQELLTVISIAARGDTPPPNERRIA